MLLGKLLGVRCSQRQLYFPHRRLHAFLTTTKIYRVKLLIDRFLSVLIVTELRNTTSERLKGLSRGGVEGGGVDKYSYFQM